MTEAATRKAKRHPALEQFFAIRRLYPTLGFTPDGKHVLYIGNASGQFNLWKVPARGGCPQQMTALEDSTVRSLSPSPDGATIVLAADRGGDEFHQIHALPARGGWPEAWTDAPQVQHFIHPRGWSPDGRALAFAANSRVPTDMDVWLRDIATGDVRQVFGGDMMSFPAAWSPDGSRLLVIDMRSNTDTSLFLVDPRSGEAEELTPHDGDVVHAPGPWAPDGSGFYLLTDRDREFNGLAFYRIAERRMEWIETPEWDVEDVDLSPDGRTLVWLVNEDGWARLRGRDLATGRETPAARLPDGCAHVLGSGLTFSPDGRHAALVWQQPRRAPEIYVVDVPTGHAKRVTESMLGGVPERSLATPELMRYESFDGRQIPAWLYRPKGRRRVPAVLAIHGGPEAQERPWYNPLYQYLVSRGIGVLATNIRGSTGYGKSYQRLIHRDWGGADLLDLEHAAKWLGAQDWVDARRLGVYGGSYGGFATLSCVSRLPDLWRAAVEAVGPSNLITFARAVPPTWRRMMAKWVGDPDDDADFLRERSPITYVENIVTPLLVLQGANDPRVVKGESDQMVERLRSLGRDVEYVVFEDEGHGFTKRANEVAAARHAAAWFERHLLSAPAAARD